MKHGVLVWGLALLLSLVALPSLGPVAQAETGGIAIYDVQTGVFAAVRGAALPPIPTGMQTHMWAQIMGRDGFAVYDVAALRIQLYGTSLPRPAAVPATLWRLVHTNDGFNVYRADQLRIRLYGTSDPKPASMPGQLWRELHTRDNFDIYALVRGGGASAVMRTQPASVPVELWQVITGRDGFGVRAPVD